ncbi:hypothetical protein [Candidatus Burkholderia verschuerenii]|uniref:hypothetical protein n=1 Tax=Candidatus Burkholderia verschuerenii TaxID=242163 RepID=UPI00067C097B|nr:hypothetical protein [Candidatus Burkholderia verschuerenii]
MFKKAFFATMAFLLSAESVPTISHEHDAPIASEVRQTYSTDCGNSIGRFSLDFVRTPPGGGVLANLKVDNKNMADSQIRLVNAELNKFFDYRYSEIQCTPIGLNVTIGARPAPNNTELSHIVFVVNREGVVGIRSFSVGRQP